MIIQNCSLEVMNELVSMVIGEGITVRNIKVDKNTMVNMSYLGHNFSLGFIGTDVSTDKLIERAYEYISTTYPDKCPPILFVL